ncbi:hypothetical protein SARC_11303 [Sphaeroforma arctica JP610]|uniref:Cytochrome b561 domain-containing protein n=1 Tax=Sphaeroforma arctica JP610 TaxID=667725 RepID=A0A0L0FI99_9EUKA|nr:hypothetical protein SARC_11303 [Sphaeroforma arctica JP610]KNC76186.1 hypothetical protein SARC_11303 [Sphaeroforma arctica JP610]|eukprot:XP_014150088.1 hypothetical protein SARC_11303 [Sphaeroforma arctica JP610]
MLSSKLCLIAASALAGFSAAQQLQWTLVSPGNIAGAPVGRANFGIDYDLARNRLVMFGGAAGGARDDTWAYNLDTNTWEPIVTATAPEPRHSFISGIDRINDRMLVTVGQGNSGFFNDVWALDLTAQTWQEVNTTGTPPFRRYAPAGGIFRGGSQMVVSHGFEAERFDDSFTFDLDTSEWREVTPAGKDSAIPSARCLVGSTMVEDGQTVMFGGCSSGGYGGTGCPGFDTWHMRTNPATPDKTGQWTQLSSSPATRNRGTLGYMSNINSVVMWGGQSAAPYGRDPDGLVNVLDLDSGLWTRVFPIVDTATGLSPISTNALGVMTFVDNSPDCVYLLTSGMDVWTMCGTTTAGLTTIDADTFFDWRLVHGVLMMLAWGILIPVGVTCAMYRGMFGGSQVWFTIHYLCNTCAWILTIAGFGIALVLNSAAKFLSVHSYIGLVILVLVALQPLNGWLRPHLVEGVKKSKRRVAWEIVHKWNGRILFLLGIVNPFLGLYYIGNRSVITFSFILYATWICLLTVFWIAMPIYLWKFGSPKDKNSKFGTSSIPARSSNTPSIKSIAEPTIPMPSGLYSPQSRRPTLVDSADV